MRIRLSLMPAEFNALMPADFYYLLDLRFDLSAFYLR